ncbi:PREDICTED: uncharacterized protein LOC106147272 [Chinchilla lanigera]|uniref:uncharacterized protein LOC106147272 n=1 Tax=Chinchilla lanigera TaxID=34839 RepID=UPI000697D81A|nr:PREDICTED: uncharacterized protein LOC106147272 [Chinchilla lanigera]
MSPAALLWGMGRMVDQLEIRFINDEYNTDGLFSVPPSPQQCALGAGATEAEDSCSLSFSSGSPRLTTCHVLPWRPSAEPRSCAAHVFPVAPEDRSPVARLHPPCRTIHGRALLGAPSRLHAACAAGVREGGPVARVARVHGCGQCLPASQRPICRGGGLNKLEAVLEEEAFVRSRHCSVVSETGCLRRVHFLYDEYYTVNLFPASNPTSLDLSSQCPCQAATRPSVLCRLTLWILCGTCHLVYRKGLGAALVSEAWYHSSIPAPRRQGPGPGPSPDPRCPSRVCTPPPSRPWQDDHRSLEVLGLQVTPRA